MGNRVKNYIGNTFEIFEDAKSGFFQKYKPTKDAVENTKALFKRYHSMQLKITIQLQI